MQDSSPALEVVRFWRDAGPGHLQGFVDAAHADEGLRRRQLTELFGIYVPPERVAQMARDPRHFDMRAEDRVLSVMFCDMRGFTKMSDYYASVWRNEAGPPGSCTKMQGRKGKGKGGFILPICVSGLWITPGTPVGQDFVRQTHDYKMKEITNEFCQKLQNCPLYKEGLMVCLILF